MRQTIALMASVTAVLAMTAVPTHAQFRDYGDAAADQYGTTTETTPTPPTTTPEVQPTTTVVTPSPTVTGASTTPLPNPTGTETEPGSEPTDTNGDDTKGTGDGGGQNPAQDSGGQNGSPGSKGLKELPFTGWAVIGMVLLALILLLLGETARRMDRARQRGV